MRGAVSTRYLIAGLIVLLVIGLIFVLRNARGPSLPAGLPADAMAVANERGLTPDDVYAALATYVPGGKQDDYVMFASGGHSGQVIAIGLPSMRILKIIPVFVPDSWSGYGSALRTPRCMKCMDAVLIPLQTRTTLRSARRMASTMANSCSSAIS